MAKAITPTRELCWASATDAANMQMRKAGRSKWNQQDADLAAETFTRLWPVDLDLASRSSDALKKAEGKSNG